MLMNRLQFSMTVTAGLVAAFAATGAVAKVSQEEAAKIGNELTPVGAERAGNEDGSIPEWKGGLPQEGELSGSYARNPEIEAEKPLFTITKDNVAQYADMIPVGNKALMERYPTYKMNVYKTHRTVSWPEEIYKWTKVNATEAEMIGTDSVKNAKLGFPFPIPKTGAEPIWNHKMKWRGENVVRFNNQAIVQADGSYQLTKLIEEVNFRYASIRRPGDSSDTLLLYLSEVMAPPRLAGQLLLVYETSDQAVDLRKAWLYNPGLRRVRRAPNVAYDNPYEGTDGNQFNDQVDMFNGAMDRYNWKLVGKKEMYIPYNSYVIQSPDVKYADIIGNKHVNQDLPRYEKHRVWIVDSTLKEGTSHTFARRTFYVEEDSWTIAAIDAYDNRGSLYKFQEGHTIFTQVVQTAGGVPEVIYDLQTGRYFLTAMANEDKPNDFSITFPRGHFTTKALKKRAQR